MGTYSWHFLTIWAASVMLMPYFMSVSATYPFFWGLPHPVVICFKALVIGCICGSALAFPICFSFKPVCFISFLKFVAREKSVSLLGLSQHHHSSFSQSFLVWSRLAFWLLQRPHSINPHHINQTQQFPPVDNWNFHSPAHPTLNGRICCIQAPYISTQDRNHLVAVLTVCGAKIFPVMVTNDDGDNR